MASKYWIGGTGNWSDTNHWSTSSGGSGGASVPTSSDDVFIDANSGFGSGGTITIADNYSVHDITANEIGYAFKIDLYAGKTLTVTGTPLLKGTLGKLITLDATPQDSQVVDSYSESNQDSLTAIGAGRIKQISQSFTGDGGTLNSAKFYLSKYKSPTGNAYAYIYAHSGTFGTSSVPTGNSLATSAPFDVSNLTTSYQLITFTFSGEEKITLTDGTKYCLLIVYNGDGNTANYIRVGRDDSSPTHNGSIAFTVKAHEDTINETDWSTNETKDSCFYVYKDGVTQHTLSKSSGTVSCDYLDISNSKATGGSTWYAGSHSVDSGNNNGWKFIDGPTTKTVTVKARVKSTGITKTVSAKTDIKRLGVGKTVQAKAKIKKLATTKTITAKASIVYFKTKTISAKARIKTTGITKTISTKARVYRIKVPKTILVSPVHESSGASPVTFIWKIPASLDNEAVHAHIQIDKTSDAFSDIEFEQKSWLDNSNMQYWNGSDWVAYPTSGVVSAYHGNQARIVNVALTNGNKWWRVKGGIG